MAELPQTMDELLRFLRNPNGEDGESISEPQAEIPTNPQLASEDLLERARSAAAYLETILHGEVADRIVILQSPS